MTKKTRRFIFYIFLILFIILTTGVILYAQGYSFDWQTKSLVVTGAFYFRSHPKEADIYINNEYRGKTNKFVKRLSPKEYDVKISKTDYHEWQKTLEINSKLVTEAKNILLIKQDPSINQIVDFDVKYLAFSDDNEKAVYLTDRATKEIDPTKQRIADPREIPTYSKFALRLLDLTDNTDIQINSSVPNLKNLSEIFWSSDNKKLLLFFPYDYYYILDLENPSKIIDLNNLIKVVSNYKIYSIKNLSFHPQDPNKIYFYSRGSLYFVELNNSSPYKSSLSPPLVSDILTYTIHDNEILYLKYLNGEFYKTNLEASSFRKIFDIPFFRAGQVITIINDKMLVINNNLYFFEPQTQVLKKIAENVEKTSFSEDKKKLLWRAKNEIGVIWLEKYETEIIMKAFKEIHRAAWYSKTDQHIVFVMGDDIKVTELDGRDKRNTVDIYSIRKPRVFYNKWGENLYILSEEKLLELNI